MNTQPSDYEQDYIMIKDAMEAIKTTECQTFIKDFGNPVGGFSMCDDPRINKIYDVIQFTGHSSSSFVVTLRNCQYLLNHPEEWVKLQTQYEN
tara:strand:- start:197 stop:475 length:279 start_codon:yes stop_codon:yes gene_type:complete